MRKQLKCCLMPNTQLFQLKAWVEQLAGFLVEHQDIAINNTQGSDFIKELELFYQILTGTFFNIMKFCLKAFYFLVQLFFFMHFSSLDFLYLPQRSHKLVAFRFEDENFLTLSFTLETVLFIEFRLLVDQLKTVLSHLHRTVYTYLTNLILLVNRPESFGRTLHKKTYWLCMASVD